LKSGVKADSLCLENIRIYYSLADYEALVLVKVSIKPGIVNVIDACTSIPDVSPAFTIAASRHAGLARPA